MVRAAWLIFSHLYFDCLNSLNISSFNLKNHVRGCSQRLKMKHYQRKLFGACDNFFEGFRQFPYPYTLISYLPHECNCKFMLSPHFYSFLFFSSYYVGCCYVADIYYSVWHLATIQKIIKLKLNYHHEYFPLEWVSKDSGSFWKDSWIFMNS